MLTELQIQELGSQLGKVLVDGFAAGETDPERLRTIAIENVSTFL